MQTIEEYKAYTRQLEGEVGKWHHAYEALMAERTQLVHKVLNLEETNAKLEKKLSTIMDGMTQPRDAEIDTLTTAIKDGETSWKAVMDDKAEKEAEAARATGKKQAAAATAQKAAKANAEQPSPEVEEPINEQPSGDDNDMFG